tara:strand:- start:37 stop:456 length:420 start_codon:yes stop_codon:yes gene_type:complete
MNCVKDINYNLDFLCTYKEFDDNYYANLCYQIQLLQSFNMSKYDEFIINNNIEKTYLYLRDNEEIKKIINILSKKHGEILLMCGNNKELENIVLFQLLFSFDYFEIFHKCLVNFLKSEIESREKSSNLFFELINYINSE